MKKANDQPQQAIGSSTSKSSQRVPLGRLLSLPPDPMTDIKDLSTRVFGKKPTSEYKNMWGKGYLEFTIQKHMLPTTEMWRKCVHFFVMSTIL